MNRRESAFRWSVALAILATTLLCATAWAQTFKVLHNFGANGDGSSPRAGLVLDNHGNLYGTTPAGSSNNCPYGCGIIFELTPGLDGSWSEIVLYDFQGNGDGFNSTAPLIFDHKGNLYGMANCSSVDCASPVVFELMPGSNGAWTESVLYTLGWQDCGHLNCQGVSFDSTGHLYGMTKNGGYGNGTIFRLSQVSSRNWREVVVHVFRGGADGSAGNGLLAFDASRNVYGTTDDGGSNHLGDVFKVTAGVGFLPVLYSFRGGTDGVSPSAGVVFDSAGNLYGVTAAGGTAGAGTVYKLTPNSDGSWSESVLYSFQGGSDAAGPNSTLNFDTAGNLYGSAGGGAYGHGAIFRLMPSSGGQWTESVVYSFTGGLDGDGPSGGLIFDNAGNLYGTTIHGGAYPTCNDEPYCGGVAYELTP
jgi:uncharacterized repeat protein (TIGR03803 family)